MTGRPPYRNVRALTRGLDILQALNRLGGAKVAELAHASGLDRTTTYRMLATLAEYGLVRANPANEEYVLTERVRRLSEGFTERDRTTQIVTAHLGALFPKVLWPTDFATFDQGAMVIRETTHRFSPYSVHRAVIGEPRPLLTTALGRAALAGSSQEDRTAMIDIMRGLHPDADERQIMEQVADIVGDYAQRGYSWSPGIAGGRTCAIGLAVRTGLHMGAAVNLVFFRSTMSIEAAAERYLQPLKTCVAGIEASLREETALAGASDTGGSGHRAEER
jgi:IclR family mhp operon transcriptional activator